MSVALGFWFVSGQSWRFYSIRKSWPWKMGHECKIVIYNCSEWTMWTSFNSTFAAFVCCGFDRNIGAVNGPSVKFLQSRRRPLLEPSPGWKHLLKVSQGTRHFQRGIGPSWDLFRDFENFANLCLKLYPPPLLGRLGALHILYGGVFLVYTTYKIRKFMVIFGNIESKVRGNISSYRFLSYSLSQFSYR